MKKLLFTLGAFACAASLQAASYLWSNVDYPVNAYNQPGAQGALQESGTMYLINAATTIDLGGGTMQALTQAYFIKTVLAAGANYESAFNTLVAHAENSGGLTAGSVFATATKGTVDGSGRIGWENGDGGSQLFYQVLIDTTNDGIYISELLTAAVQGSADTELFFLNDGAYKNNAYGTDITTFQSDGWYTANVPEPTSGLLLLLGMSCLALKRKRV